MMYVCMYDGTVLGVFCSRWKRLGSDRFAPADLQFQIIIYLHKTSTHLFLEGPRPLLHFKMTGVRYRSNILLLLPCCNWEAAVFFLDLLLHTHM